MADKTAIQWTDATWNPIRARYHLNGKTGWHCEHASPGCINCYAESMNRWRGTGLPFKPGHRQHIDIFLDEKILHAPLRWKRPRMVFPCSMTDIGAEFVKDEWLDQMFAVMALCPQHVFQVLTKRPERFREYLANDAPWPLKQIWLGTSVEDQQRADERIPVLHHTPAALRWVSAEPLLGPVDLTAVSLDWIVIGGESGRDARPFDLAWARRIIADFRTACVPVYVKQLGARPVDNGTALQLAHPKGGDPVEWPADLRVRQWPEVAR